MPTHIPSLVNTKSLRKTSAAANSIFIPRSFFNRKSPKKTSAPKSLSALNASNRRTANNPVLHCILRKRRNHVNAAHRGHSTTSQANGGLPDSLPRAMTRSPVMIYPFSLITRSMSPNPDLQNTPPFYESPGDDVILSDPSPNQELYDILMLLIATSGVEAYPLSRFSRRLTGVYSNEDVDYALSHHPFTVSAGFVTYNPSKDESPTRPERYKTLIEFAKKHDCF